MQRCRAAVSVTADIAEGRGHRSSGEFVYFLRLTNGRGTEPKSLVTLSHRVGYCPSRKADEL